MRQQVRVMGCPLRDKMREIHRGTSASLENRENLLFLTPKSVVGYPNQRSTTIPRNKKSRVKVACYGHKIELLK